MGCTMRPKSNDDYCFTGLHLKKSGFPGEMSDTKTGVQKVQDECATCCCAKN